MWYNQLVCVTCSVCCYAALRVYVDGVSTCHAVYYVSVCLFVCCTLCVYVCECVCVRPFSAKVSLLSLHKYLNVLELYPLYIAMVPKYPSFDN